MTQQHNVETPGGFFGSLFDLSFRTYITPKIIRILYVLSLVAIAIWALVFFIMIIASFDDPFTPIGLSIVMLLLWPVGVLFGIIYARVLLEFVAVVFRIGEAADATARHTAPPGGATPPPPGPGPTPQGPPGQPWA